MRNRAGARPNSLQSLSVKVPWSGTGSGRLRTSRRSLVRYLKGSGDLTLRVQWGSNRERHGAIEEIGDRVPIPTQDTRQEDQLGLFR